MQIAIPHVWVGFSLFFMSWIALAVMLIREIITAVAAAQRIFCGESNVEYLATVALSYYRARAVHLGNGTVGTVRCHRV